MIFWATIAALAILTGAVLTLTLIRGRVGDAPPAAYDLEVYRDQLKEVDRDLSRGVLNEAEAQRVRAEVSRRILTADAQLQAGTDRGGVPGRVGVALAAVLGVCVSGGAVLLYGQIGAPGYGDLPIAQRLANSETLREKRLSQDAAETRAGQPPDIDNPRATPEFLALMDRLRDTVAARPGDLQGLALLARNEAALGNMRAARDAQAQLIEAKGQAAADAADHATLAEFMITAAGGYVSTGAEAALRAALQADSRNPTARYYLGVYLLQVDRPDRAFKIWRELIEESRPGAPWVPPIRARIEEVAQRAGVRYTLPPESAAPRGPDAAAIAGAEDMSPEDRQAMIRGMVEGLATRLAEDGGPAADWARLIGAYAVLGEDDAAARIWAEAQTVFAGNPDQLARIRSAARNAGLAE